MGTSKRNTMLLGGVLGALGGVAIAMLLVRRAESEGREEVITAGEGLRLGMLMIGLLQQVRALSDGN